MVDHKAECSVKVEVISSDLKFEIKNQTQL